MKKLALLSRHSQSRYFRFPLVVMIIAWTLAYHFRGWPYLLSVAMLTAFEVTVSFDNATVDAKLLARMSPFWQRVFLTIGVVIGVGFVRMLFPIAMVSVTTAIGFGQVWHEAWHNQALYQLNLQHARPAITALAAPFLGLTFLNWVITRDSDRDWPVMAKAERFLKRIGQESPTYGPLVLVAGILVMIFLISTGVDPVGILIAKNIDYLAMERSAIWLAFGLVSIIAYGLVHYLNIKTEASLERDDDELPGRSTFWRGLAQLARLELVDASFSLDSVSGAFAITRDFTAILIGLGVGALFVRAFVKLAVDQGTLEKYRDLENGAQWSIGALAVILPISVVINIPELATGLVSISLVGASMVTSAVHNHRQQRGHKLVARYWWRIWWPTLLESVRSAWARASFREEE